MKQELQLQAIELRRQGLTYSEILERVPVSRSTLSLWLRSVQLTKIQEQRYTEKKRLASLRGGLARKLERIQRQQAILKLAKSQIDQISKRELWLMGIMLYWAEGTKEKAYRTGEVVVFSNSDPKMIVFFLKWIDLCVGIPPEEILCILYIHENHSNDLQRHIDFWNKIIGMRYNSLQKVYFKKNALSPRRKNTSENYHGQFQIKIRNSIDLNRKIAGWIEGICSVCPVV